MALKEQAGLNMNNMTVQARYFAEACCGGFPDSLEKNNDIEIFVGDSAKESALLYADGMRRDTPERGAFVFCDCKYDTMRKKDNA